MRQYAVSHIMVVKLAAENRGGAMLKYQCAGGGDCRFEVTRLRSQGQALSGYFTSYCNLEYRTITVNSFSSTGGRAHPIFSG
ncbi:Peptidase M14 [Phytophthora palmivora]|uniref:Peptidase M14 n=1 Tax=Phytophthora palmivora TaxID=4796 RepID=A0A2P4Y290_9STRA|nr:Peptidase M14 [Phytophthora palmivora]